MTEKETTIESFQNAKQAMSAFHSLYLESESCHLHAASICRTLAGARDVPDDEINATAMVVFDKLQELKDYMEQMFDVVQSMKKFIEA
jgi:hypothetical protein